MTRDDRLEGQIRAVLAAEAATRRVVAVRTPSRRGQVIRKVAFFSSRAVPATLLVTLVATAAGLGLADWRAQRQRGDEPRSAAGEIPGPLALGGGAPSLGFGLVSTAPNTLLVRNETTESAPYTFAATLPQVAVSPNGHDIAYWVAVTDPQVGKAGSYELHVRDLIGPAGGAPSREGRSYLTSTDEMPFALRWSSDGTGLIAGTRTFVRRGAQSQPPDHATWFVIDIASAKATRLPSALETQMSEVYAWDRQRDLITGSGQSAGQNVFIRLEAGRFTSTAVPTGSVFAAADAYGRSIVVVSATTCPDGKLRCSRFEVHDQSTFDVTMPPVTEQTTDYPDVVFRPRSQDLIVQLPLTNGQARVELWTDLGRGVHQVLASYTQSGRFTARREVMLPRVDGSAVFLLKFDDSSGGRWFGELVGLSDGSQSPFEIRTGGNPLASIVLDRAFATALSGKVAAPNTKGPAAATPTSGGTPSRCADGRPQSEINAAGLLPHEPRSPLVECVLIAEGTSRVYRLRDGRRLQVFEYPGGLPVKPTAAPLQTGTRMVGSQSWSWMTVNGQTVLSTTLPDRVYVELDLPTSSNVNADLDTLQSIASTLRASSTDCGSARLPNASSTYDQAMLDCVWAAYTRGETARVSITMVTTEGAPVPTTLLAVPGGRSVVTRDVTADQFSSPAERVVSTYSCSTLTRRPWATNPARYAFELSNCTGPRATVSFP